MAQPLNPSNRGRKTQINWTDYMDECMANILVEEALLGRKADNAFREVTINKVCKMVEEIFSVHVSSENCRNRLRLLKSKYLLIKLALSKSGFGWDDERKYVTAEAAVWNGLIQTKPEIKKIRNKSFPLLKQFESIYGDDSAIGSYARTPADPDEEDVMPTYAFDDIQLSPVNSDAYTPFAPMDSSFWDGTQSETQQSGGSSKRTTGTSTPRPSKKKKATIGSTVVERFNGLCGSIDKFVVLKSTTDAALMTTKLWEELENMITIDEDMMYKAFRFLSDRPNLIHGFLHSVSPAQWHVWLENMVPR